MSLWGLKMYKFKYVKVFQNVNVIIAVELYLAKIAGFFFFCSFSLQSGMYLTAAHLFSSFPALDESSLLAVLSL